jgi:hypothetical protein
MATMPLWQGQQHQLDDVNIAIGSNKGNNVIVMMAKTPFLGRRLHIDNGDTIAMMMTTPAWRQQKDACALMMAATPLL